MGKIMHQGRLKDGLYAWTSTVERKLPIGNKLQTCNAYFSVSIMLLKFLKIPLSFDMNVWDM
uniref:Uncharacterized protein n=1 Tax=Nymphaea colorata TaxID=210225 RepID=A0A5K1B7T9_9MAGN